MRAWFPALALTLVGCGGTEVSVTPAQIDWGDVDFNRARPDGGYDEVVVRLTHASGGPVDLVLRDVDEDHIVVVGPLQVEDPPTLNTLGAGDIISLTVGVWDYEAGERDTAVTGTFRLTADGLKDDLEIPWSFVPVRDQDE